MEKATLMNSALTLFVSECCEQMDRLEALLLALERDQTDGQGLDEMFRMIHTIKGNASVMQAAEIEWFAHIIESVLGRLRNNIIRPDRTLISTLLPCIDHLRFLVSLCTMPEKASQQFADEERARLIGLLVPYLGDQEDLAFSTQPHVRDSSSWSISVRFAPNVLQQGLDPMYFFLHLQTIGRITALETVMENLPPSKDYNPEHCYLRFELALDTVADKQGIEDAFTLVRDACDLRITPPPNKTQSFIELISSLPNEDLHLGEMLVRIGALTSEELAVALRSQRLAEQQHRTEREIGQVLVEEGYVEAELIDAVLRRQSDIRVTLAQEHRLLHVKGEQVVTLEDLLRLIHHGLERLKLESAGSSEDSLIARQIPALIAQTRHALNITHEIQRIRLDEVFRRLHRVLRDTAHELGKQADLLLSGGELEVERTLGEGLASPLIHLVRNALDHGLEPPAERVAAGKNARGLIRLDAWLDDHSLFIQLADDGAGVDRGRIRHLALAKGLLQSNQHIDDEHLLALLFTPGFSTTTQVTQISGRGVGLDVVKKGVEALGGSITIRSFPARGTRFEICLPLVQQSAQNTGASSYQLRY